MVKTGFMKSRIYYSFCNERSIINPKWLLPKKAKYVGHVTVHIKDYFSL